MISDGLIVVAKRDCPTCVLVEDVFRQLGAGGPAAHGLQSGTTPRSPPMSSR